MDKIIKILVAVILFVIAAFAVVYLFMFGLLVYLNIHY